MSMNPSLMPIQEISANEPDAYITNWEFARSPYGGPSFLYGEIHRDKSKRFADGTQIRTSKVKRIEIDVMDYDRVIVTTNSGTRYALVDDGNLPTLHPREPSFTPIESEPIEIDADFDD